MMTGDRLLTVTDTHQRLAGEDGALDPERFRWLVREVRGVVRRRHGAAVAENFLERVDWEMRV